MSRVSLARRAITVTAASMMLMGAMLVPFAGVASAAGGNCYTGEGATVCTLVIKAPPSVQTNTNFVARVLVTDGENNVASSDPCGATAPVALELLVSNGDGYTLVQSYGTHNAVNGVATFTASIATAGNYFLHAFADFGDGGPPSESPCFGVIFNDDFKSVHAFTLAAGEPIFPCFAGTSCVQASSGTGTQATMIAGSGDFTPATGFPNFFGPVTAMPTPGPSLAPAVIGCGDGGPLDANGVLGFHLDNSRSHFKVVVFAFDREAYNLKRGKSIFKYDICWQQDTLFTPKGGGPKVFRGYLPNCSFWDDRWEHGGRDDARRSGPPCVLIRFSDRQWNGYIAVIAPIDATGHDPFGYGH